MIYGFLFNFHRHSRKHFSSVEPNQVADVQRLMGMLAFNSKSPDCPYSVGQFLLTKLNKDFIVNCKSKVKNMVGKYKHIFYLHVFLNKQGVESPL